MKHIIYWSRQEIDDLKANYPNGLKLCKIALLRHTPRAVGIKARSLGLKVKARRTFNNTNKIRWIDYELVDIKRNFKEKGAAGCQVAQLRHSANAVSLKARQLGITQKKREPYWMKAEERDLRVHFPSKGAKGCRLALMRHTKVAVYRKATVLGIKSERGLGASVTWTPREAKDIFENYHEKGAKGCVIAAKKHTISAIRVFASHKGLTKVGWGSKVSWSEKEIEDVKLNYAKGGVKACKIASIRHTKPAIRTFARRNGWVTSRAAIIPGQII